MSSYVTDSDLASYTIAQAGAITSATVSGLERFKELKFVWFRKV